MDYNRRESESVQPRREPRYFSIRIVASAHRPADVFGQTGDIFAGQPGATMRWLSLGLQELPRFRVSLAIVSSKLDIEKNCEISAWICLRHCVGAVK